MPLWHSNEDSATRGRYRAIFQKILRIFDGVGNFKGLKSHDVEANGGETWSQNVRKDVNFNMSITRVLGAKRVKFDGYFSIKNAFFL